MVKINKKRFALFLIGIIMLIVGFVLHFYYGPVYIRWAVIGGVVFFLGFLLIVVLVIMGIICRVRIGVKKEKNKIK